MDDLRELKPKVKTKRGKFWWLLLLIPIILFIFFWKFDNQPSVFNYVFGGSTLESEDGKVNVLLLGMAGGKHDGATLTDTIMVASFDSQTLKTTLISLPRDLWLESKNAKINTLYQSGLKEKKGLENAEKGIGEVIGLTIPYAVRIDFSGFIKAVDLVGGLEVNVENSFDDYLYPVEGKENDLCGLEQKDMDLTEEQAKAIGLEKGMHQVLVDASGKIATASAQVGGKIEFSENSVGQIFPCRYERIKFTRGLMNLDGTTALKFVRSRHGTNGEGSDFARSKRQQLVIQSFKDKVLSANTLLDPKKIIDLIGTLGSSVETDIPQSKFMEFAKIVKKVKGTESIVIDSSGKDPLLIAPPAGKYGAWVLVPSSGNFDKIHQFVNNALSDKPASESAKEP